MDKPNKTKPNQAQGAKPATKTTKKPTVARLASLFVELDETGKTPKLTITVGGFGGDALCWLCDDVPEAAETMEGLADPANMASGGVSADIPPEKVETVKKWMAEYCQHIYA